MEQKMLIWPLSWIYTKQQMPEIAKKPKPHQQEVLNTPKTFCIFEKKKKIKNRSFTKINIVIQ